MGGSTFGYPRAMGRAGIFALGVLTGATSIAWAGLALPACRGPRTCERPLGEYCDGPCPTLEEAIKQAQGGEDRSRENVTVERCGNYTRIHYSHVDYLYGAAEYFEASGHLVGVVTADDNVADCYGEIIYGTRPECEPECVLTSIPYCEEPCEPSPIAVPCE
jgi:hypothetical protein